jgi:hypothetical protein
VVAGEASASQVQARVGVDGVADLGTLDGGERIAETDAATGTDGPR